jgi:hypothetical protein
VASPRAEAANQTTILSCFYPRATTGQQSAIMDSDNAREGGLPPFKNGKIQFWCACTMHAGKG